LKMPASVIAKKIHTVMYMRRSRYLLVVQSFGSIFEAPF
jgi:hypothetical protein